MNRVSRVAHRIGITLGAVCIVGAAALTFMWALYGESHSQAMNILVTDTGLLAGAAAAYAAARAVGWIINGWKDPG